jgi:hypothetical protein
MFATTMLEPTGTFFHVRRLAVQLKPFVFSIVVPNRPKRSNMTGTRGKTSSKVLVPMNCKPAYFALSSATKQFPLRHTIVKSEGQTSGYQGPMPR